MKLIFDACKASDLFYEIDKLFELFSKLLLQQYYLRIPLRIRLVSSHLVPMMISMNPAQSDSKSIV